MDSLAEARKVQEGLVRDYPTVVKFQADLAHIHGQTGAIQSYQGRQVESLTNLGDARKILLDHGSRPSQCPRLSRRLGH